MSLCASANGGGTRQRQIAALTTPRELLPIELNGVIAEVAHVAYHMGAIRQIHAATRGPRHDAS